MPDRALLQILREVASASRHPDALVFGKISDLARAVSWSVRVVRPDDLLVLSFTFFNLRRDGDALERRDPGDAYLVVGHQSQSLADAAYASIADQATYAQDPDLSGREPPPAPHPVPPKEPVPALVPIRASGPSRVAYTMPSDLDRLPFTLDALLEASRTWPLHLDAAAKPDEAGFRPQIIETILEDLRATRLALRKGSEGLISEAQFDRLDRHAESISRETIESVEGRSRVGAREVESRIEQAVEAVVRRVEGGREANIAARLYVRASAGERAFSAASAANTDVGKLAEYMPGFYGVLLAPREPGVRVTAIEIPWRLIGSPLAGAGFDHALRPVIHGGRTETWHSRLGRRRSGPNGPRIDDKAEEKMRYLWSPDYKQPFARTPSDPTFSLDGLDRQMIVKLTAGYTENHPDGSRYVPRAVIAKHLMLSALGGTLDADRRWRLRPNDVDMMAWTHRASQGRDAYVRVEYSGFLYPFGHAATLVKISERTFEWRNGEAGRRRIAVLRQRFFIIVRDRTRDYPRGAPQPFDGRAMPFKSIECLVTTTPDFATPGGNPADRLDDGFYQPDEYRRAFWPSRGALGLYRFPLVGIDTAGRRVPFNMPLMFVSEVYNRSGKLPAIQDHYNGVAHNPAPISRRQPSLNGAAMRFAEPDGNEAADVDYPARTLLFRAADPSGGVSARQQADLQQQPILEKAVIQLASVERLTGQDKAPTVSYDPDYLASDFTGGGEVFMRIEGSDPLEFGASGSGSDAVGGLATPSMIPAGLSRRHGVASAQPGELDSFKSGDFVPSQYFPSAKLLGFFDLKDILEPASLGDASPVVTTNEFPDRFETRFRLVQDIPKKTVQGLMTGEGGQTRLDLTATTILWRNATPPDSRVEGILTNFKIDLAGVIVLHFDRLRFFKQTGRKPDVDVDLNPATGVTFGGPLEFINTLKDYIPSNGFSDPPDLQVTAAGITAGYSLGLPAVQCGILSLSNISLGASFSLPFNGDAPTARFNFAERHNCFNLTVSLFGGGGFFGLVVGASGVQEIEAALEFGAQIAIDLGVASGSVYVKGGFYFHYAESPERVEFEGYVELGGRLSILGLVSVSLTFHLSLAYESEQLPDKADGSPHSKSKLFGQATLVVEVEVLFFSASVKVKVEKTFAGSEADPLFIDFIPAPSVWEDYCDAFA